MSRKHIFLSYFIDKNTPTYGNRNVVELLRKSDMSRGDVANETHIQTTLHVGTHIDFPSHFFKEGQTMKSFPAGFWFFERALLIEIQPRSLVVKNEVIEELDKVSDKENVDILLIKTGYCALRGSKKYWEQNIGFSPDIYDYLKHYFPCVRVMGFDSISVSGFQHRDIGRVAHHTFLNPEKPVLLLEDMDLSCLTKETRIFQVWVSPLMISEADGVPCTVIAVINQP